MPWNPFILDNPIGLVTNQVNPPFKSFSQLKNFELREKKGEIWKRKGTSSVYAPPTVDAKLSSVTWLKADNFYCQSSGIGQEITILIGKGTLAAYSNDFVAAASINILLIYASHYWDGSAWQEGWTWLNECALTTLHTISGSDYDIQLDFEDAAVIAANKYAGWTLYNIDADFAAWVGAVYEYGATNDQIGIYQSNNSHSWTDNATAPDGGDAILLMKSYIPYAFLTNVSSLTSDDIMFYKVKDELRISFGGEANKNTLSISYIKNFLDDFSFHGSKNIDDARTRDGLYVEIYNASGLESYSNLADSGTGAPAGELTPSASNYGFIITAILDGYQEFVIHKEFYTNNLEEAIIASWGANLGTLSRRVTQFRIWWCTADANDKQTSQFFLWDDNDYILTYATDTASGLFSISNTGDINFGNNFYDADKLTKTELENALGYYPTTNYIKSFDHATIASDTTLAIRCYDDKLYDNQIFYSPVDGDGTPMYDVIPTLLFHQLEKFDNDDIVGIAALENGDAVICREKSNQILDPNTSRILYNYNGHGCVSKQSIVELNGLVTWASELDIVNSQRQELLEHSVRDTYRKLSSAEKAGIIATVDEYENYRFHDGSSYSREYVINPEYGVLMFSYPEVPVCYIRTSDNNLWYMANNGRIIKHDKSRDSNGYFSVMQDVDQDASAIDISLLLRTNKMDSTFLQNTNVQALFSIRDIFVEYISADAFIFSLYYNDYLYKAITVPASATLSRTRHLFGLNSSGKNFSLDITLTTSDQVFVIRTIGGHYKLLPKGQWGS